MSVIFEKYIGEFFSITNFDELDCLTIDLVEIEKQYDVIVTDVMVGKSEELEIFFFYKMIPEAIIDRLNEFLNVSFTDNNVMVKNLEAPSSSKSHSDKEVQNQKSQTIQLNKQHHHRISDVMVRKKNHLQPIEVRSKLKTAQKLTFTFWLFI